MRVLVTGHLGYIGTALTPTLLQRGHDVVGYDSDLYARCTLGPPEAIASVPSLRKDIRDAELADLAGIDAVLHLAGLSNDPLGDFDPSLTYDINFRASVRLAELAKRAGIQRFIFSSSCSNYGAAGDDLLDEQAAFNPVTPYGKSKVLVERELSRMADDTFSPTFLRNATAFGVSPRLRFDLVLNNLMAWAFTSRAVLLKSDGTPWRPIVHIEDIARAFVAVLEAPRSLVHNEAFNVGSSGQNYRIRDLANIVQRRVEGSTIQFADGASPDRRNYRVSCDKFARFFPDFAPRWRADQGADELYAAFTQLAITVDDFEGPKYKRIAHIQQLVAQGVLDDSLRVRARGAIHQYPAATRAGS